MPGRSTASTPTSGLSWRAGEVAPSNPPASTVSVDSSTSSCGSAAWWANAGSPNRVVVRLRHPQLHAVQSAAIAAGRLLGVGDPAPGGHQVELARGDQLLGAEAVPVQHLAGDQPGDGVQTGVRVRADVEAVLLGDPDRAHVVGEAPRADGAAVPARERSAHRHRADPGLAALADLDAGCFGDAGRVDDRRVRGVHRSAHPRSMGPTPSRRPAPARVVSHFAGWADSGRDGTHVASASCVLARASIGPYRRWHGAAGRG